VIDVTIPALGMAMTEALLAAWLKEPGDAVAAGEPIAEIETDKATMELESPATGMLGKHLFAAGSMVPVAGLVCRVLQPGEVEPSEVGPSEVGPGEVGPGDVGPGDVEDADRPGVRVATKEAVVESAATAVPPSVEPAGGAVPGFDGIFDELREGRKSDLIPSAVPKAQPGQEPFAARRPPHTQSPRQRRLARLAANDEPSVAPRPSRRREAIAARVAESWRTIPHFAVTRELDATDVVDALRELRRAVPAATVTDLLLHAFSTMITTLPGSASGDVGMAVATPDGVMMPVILDADALAVADLVSARQAAAQRARDGRLTEVDMSARPVGSLSNLGALGVDSFTGIIPLGQQCLMTVGRIAPRIIARERMFALRDTINATLNVDHRTIDGDDAARALDVFAQALGSLHSWVKGETT
jgi:pyruvate dehydrogenase E2 component (dihydrolipoamide acetyltransferase)